MNLIDDNITSKKKEGNSKKIATIILIVISILIVAIIAIFVAIYYIKDREFKFYVDGVQNDKVGEMMTINDDEVVYFPIKDIAEYLGYKSFNGEYTEKSEDPSKCYIECEDEVVNFTLNSNTIYKLTTTNSNNNYDYYHASKPIKAINGKLYAPSDAIEEAFNATFSYDSEAQRAYIYTMPYLISLYETKVLDFGYERISEDFTNKKAVLNSELVVSKNQNKDYGVIDLSGNTIIEPKYDYIEFIPESGDFLIKSNNKYGVISAKREMKLQISFDKIELIDSDSGLFVVQKENKYGIIDSKGNTKVYLDYDRIGIDNGQFDKNGIKNKYLLSNGMIPAMKDGLWGAFNKNGKVVLDFEYDSFGYIASTNKDAINLLIIPDYELLVACKNRKYALVNSAGEELIKPVLDDVYITVTSGKKYYYMNAGDQTYNIIEFLEAQGVKPTNTNNQSTTNDDSRNEETTNNNEDNNNVDNNRENEEEEEQQSSEEEPNYEESEEYVEN